jgi:hypothetical protein
MVLLKYLGTEGTGASNLDLRNIFRIGRGTSGLYKNRSMLALRSLRDQAITWPDEEERQQISERVQRRHLFPNCVGFIDGTLFPLATAPQCKDAPDYSGRKHKFSLRVMIINDDQRLIRYYLSGWPGSAHDNRVWNQTQPCMYPEKYFGDKQYILGDSAFENSNNMVSSFKCPRGMELPRYMEVFNTALASPRISSEHTIGMLKGRFPWLWSIRMIITEDKKSLKKILMYIDVCIILHNLLIHQQDPVLKEWMNSGDKEDPLDEYVELNKAVPPNSKKDTRRQQLTVYINETYVDAGKITKKNQGKPKSGNRKQNNQHN